MSSLMHGYQVIGRDWRYVYVSPSAGNHGGRRPHHLVGRLMWDAYPGIERTDMFAALQQCMNGAAERVFENEFTFPDGTRRWFELRIQPVPEGIAVHSLDIQERKDREMARRRRREKIERERSLRASIGRIWSQCTRIAGFDDRQRPDID